MRSTRNPGRVAGLWYLLLVLLGPLRLIYIPSKLFVAGNAPATVKQHRRARDACFGSASRATLPARLCLIFLTLAFYRLFAGVDQSLAVQVVIFGGVMPALLYFVGVASDLGVLLVARGADFLSVFDKPQQDALAMLLLQLRGLSDHRCRDALGSLAVPAGSAGVPVALSAAVSGGVAGALNGIAYVVLSFTGVLRPEWQHKVFVYSQPAMFGEMALMLWLVIKGARPAAVIQ
jgi:hypothetical protein